MSGNVLSQFRDSQSKAKPARAKSVLQQALDDYFQRQGRMAQQGLDQAEQGAGQLRGGDPMGALNMLMGPAGYLASPINALFPERSEIDAAGDVPQWSKPLLAGGLETAAIMAPGPKGGRLGKGLDELGDAATDAERLALQARLEAEAAQTGGQAVATSRDQALRNLTEAPEWNAEALKARYARMNKDALLAEASKRAGLAIIASKMSGPKLRQALFQDDVNAEQSRNLGKMVDEALKKDPTVW